MTPEEILLSVFNNATAAPHSQAVSDQAIRRNLEYVSKCISNRAGIRLLMSCLLAKVHKPQVDPRKPYTEINTDDCFSGRTYDERYLTHFINENQLPCNVTTGESTMNLVRPTTCADITLFKGSMSYLMHAIGAVDIFYNGAIGVYEKKGFVHVGKHHKQLRWNG